MSYQLSDDHRLRRRRPGAASSAEQQRLEVHRSLRRYATLLEKRRGRMGLEDRVASRRDYMESVLSTSTLKSTALFCNPCFSGSRILNDLACQ